MSGLTPPKPLAYTGQIAVAFTVHPFAPTTHDFNFDLSTIWIDPTTAQAWILLAKPMNVADWVLFAGGGVGNLVTLSAEGGTATPPDGSGNFDFSGQDLTLHPLPPFVQTDTVTFGVIADGKMQASAVYPHWQVITTSQSAAKSQGYLVNHMAGLVTITLPASPLAGDSFQVADVGGGTFKIAQNAGDSIQLGIELTTTGVTGNITSTQKGDNLTLVCWASGPGASWIAFPTPGTFTVT